MLHNLALLLEAKGGFAEAELLYRQAAQAAPDDPRRWEALANHLREGREFEAAEVAYRQALALGPEAVTAATSLACVLLAQGRREEGWAAFDQRRARRKLLAGGLSFPEWRGEPLAGKRLLVIREQGFGDQIMMARYLTELDAAAVTYAGPQALARLFAPLPVTYLTVSAEGFEVPPHDYWTLPLSLPRWCDGEIPPPPYLSGRGNGPRGGVGVVWRGEPTNANNSFRSLPESIARDLLALPGAVSLDPADTGAEDFQATADLIAGLDLVITVDTAVAHLAGAMGAPVWMMLAARALDWQWPRVGASLWYPSARLFTQPRPGDWASVFADVRAGLARP